MTGTGCAGLANSVPPCKDKPEVIDTVSWYASTKESNNAIAVLDLANHTARMIPYVINDRLASILILDFSSIL